MSSNFASNIKRMNELPFLVKTSENRFRSNSLNISKNSLSFFLHVFKGVRREHLEEKGYLRSLIRNEIS